MIRATITWVEPQSPFVAILEQARRGDGQALEILAQRFYPTVERLVHRRLSQDLRSSKPWLAARFSTGDVVQEVFLGVLRDLGSFAGESEDAFVGYLAMVVRNRIIDAVRFHQAECRDGRRAAQLDSELGIEASRFDPTNDACSAEQRARLQGALARLEHREQLLLRARLENLATFEELAAQLGYRSESGARRAYYAAHARLAIALKGLS